MRRRRRSAYTLLEVVLALLIAMMLLAALYGAIGLQLRQANAGRRLVERTTLVRSIINRLETDLAGAITLNDPARYRTQNAQAGGGGAGGGAMAAGGTAAAGQSGGVGPLVLPLSVIGDGDSVTVFISRLPTEAWPDGDKDGQLVSDLRRITYWLDGDKGLCRHEMTMVVSQDALDSSVPPSTADVNKCKLAPEVKELEITYYDGASWVEQWDSTTLADDGITPIGPPRAIRFRLGVRHRHISLDREPKDVELFHYQHVIPLVTANGATQSNNNADATNGGAQSSGGGTSP